MKSLQDLIRDKLESYMVKDYLADTYMITGEDMNVLIAWLASTWGAIRPSELGEFDERIFEVGK